MSLTKFDSPYNPKETESRIYKKWLDSGYFNPDKLPKTKNQKSFSIMMPPPNVTGTLHIGHALFVTIQDILTRVSRMQGKKALWLPGTDHAAIATQSKVEKELFKKEKKTRHDLGREAFLKLVEQFAQSSHDTIINQLQAMGASADWSREAYTLDNVRSNAVREAFKRMYQMGLIYRGHRIVNWDPKLQTTVSDDEILWQEQKTPFYYFKYGPFTIGTARPETKFGDKYIVMHPNDKRYKKYEHGDKLEVEWINGKVTATIIKDEAVDMEFGTGVMTITPWHDKADFDIAEKHKLDREQIIDDRGLLLPIAEEFAGQHIKKVRPLIVEKLKAKDLLEKVDENYVNRVAINSRGEGIIEPQIKLQWFIDVNKRIKNHELRIKEKTIKGDFSLKEIMRLVVEKGAIKITPQHFEKIYFHWIDNLRDWCISRQLWYGHRIPVWYRSPLPSPGDGEGSRERSKEIYVDTELPSGEGWEQDPDTLDTWFSSGIWTFSTLGWPENTSDLKTYHPTDVLETGYDILFFWVARMILMTGALLGEVPFRKVYLHGLVRDAEKQKMSKSKGNVIDPLVMSEKYGTDALRFALVFNTAPGTDMSLAEDKISGMKKFANKLWNISRYVLNNIHEKDSSNLQATSHKLQAKTDADKKILAKLNETIESVTKNIENFNLHEAAQTIYHFVWHELADVYIEVSKEQLKDENLKKSTLNTLFLLLNSSLRLLHPFMPFITEEIWKEMKQKDLLTISEWPKSLTMKLEI